MIETGSDFSGVGAFEQALIRLGIDYKTVFACEMDKYARKTYIENYGTASDLEIVNSKTHDKICDMMMRIANGVAEGSPEFFKSAENLAKSFSFYYPLNVYNREIPKKPLDIYIPTPPCQSFSLAGKRKGEDSVNGVLFYNSHEFIQENKPRFFIFENVKGLLSDAKGRTFQIWLDMLGGKSVNGNPVIFPREDATPYHIYHQVLNAKHYGVPQNRERVFIVGIRDDSDNTFHWPKPFYLVKRLKDVLEDDVDEKYYLSDKMIKGFISKKTNGFKGRFKPKTGEDSHSNCVTTGVGNRITDNFIEDSGYINQDTQASKVHSKYKESPTISAGSHGYANGYVQVKSATKKGYEIATENDSINLSQPNSETRRGRVGKGVAQTLDTACNQAVIINPLKGKTQYGWHFEQNVYAENSDITRSIMAGQGSGSRAKVIENCKQEVFLNENQLIKFNSLKVDENISGCITNAIGRAGSSDEYMSSIKRNALITNTIRRLTPRECFSLMDFPDSFKMPCSNTQMYKQAGNTVVVNMWVEITNKLNL